MPFIIAALVPIVNAIGSAAGTAVTVPNGIVTPEDAGLYDLDVHGLLIPLGVPSAHVVWDMPDHTELIGGHLTFDEEACQPLLEALPGAPVYGADKQTRIGIVTRAWMEEDALRIEGRVVDRAAVRFHIANQRCGLCLAYRHGEQGSHGPLLSNPGEDSLRLPSLKPPLKIFVMMPGDAGYSESWVKFTDPTINEATYRAIAAPWEW